MKKINTLLLALLIIFLISCDKDRDDIDNNYILLEMQQRNEMLEYDNPNFELSLYGYNETVADAEATLIVSQDFGADEFPFTVRMDIPADPYAEIPNIEDNTNARFYITIQWDSDDNGQNCAGDIDLDNSIQNVGLININRRDAQDIYLGTIPETSSCQ
ncbi:hypothetical protein RM553_18285 [Zunongwangia sp. F363]|uniref:Lipoprotein n=1 Tax=Autumnicola tepida TaxID=3075595 RepID=A0ABU3CEM6_9FLAO|nr:hypothetical protein [Zunongwangia sp. F363]MDT0644795.1 hypothetical protein [Zunongwangia sp. F363]